MTSENKNKKELLFLEPISKDTPVDELVEKLAKKLQCPVFYANVSPQKFGYYKITFELVISWFH